MEPMSSHVINMVGPQIALGPFEREFVPYYQQWINDFEVTRYYLSWLRPRTREEREAWYERVSRGDTTLVDFLMYERATMRPIGYTTLEDIDSFNRCATYGILIGESVRSRRRLR